MTTTPDQGRGGRPAASQRPSRPLGSERPDAGRDDWARLLARWDVVPGTPSERALATAVLLDAPLYPLPIRRVAAVILTTFDTTFDAAPAHGEAAHG